MRHPAAERTSAARLIGRPARILVVEDNQALRGLHAEILEMEGYEVASSEDGVDALERLASEEFDLVVTDRMMPALDGASMVLALRSAGSRIPVVMVSGSLVQSPLPPGVAREISAALPKPARLDQMLAAVARALKAEPGEEASAPTETGPIPRIRS